jgi:hypothetical protein
MLDIVTVPNDIIFPVQLGHHQKSIVGYRIVFGSLFFVDEMQWFLETGPVANLKTIIKALARFRNIWWERMSVNRENGNYA